MSFLLLGIILLLFGALIKVFINNYDKLTEEEKEDVAKAIRDSINNRNPFDSV